MYVLCVCIILPLIAHLSFQNFSFFYITAHTHKRYVYMYTYVNIHICIYYMYVLYVYTYAHLSFKKTLIRLKHAVALFSIKYCKVLLISYNND